MTKIKEKVAVENEILKIEDAVYETITRNYSRREGIEMFTLTETRLVDSRSSFTRKRAEKYIALYDVEIQLLEEMVPLEYVTKDFLQMRRRVIATQLYGLVKRLNDEMETVGEYEKALNEDTIIDINLRVGDFRK